MQTKYGNVLYIIVLKELFINYYEKFYLVKLLLSDHSFLSGFFGVRSAPSENLSPTSVKNNEKSNKNQLPLLPITETEKLKEKQKDKSKKEDDKKTLKLPDLQAKSPDSSFGSMDFDQNDLRRSTPNAEEIESAPKTTNPLLMNFIKNSNEQKNLEAIREETPEGKNKTPKVAKTSKDAKKNKEEKEITGSEIEDTKDVTKKDKKEKKEKKKEKKIDEIKDEPVLKDQGGDINSLEGDSNLFSIEPISERKTEDEAEKKKSKKGGKGKNKSKE